jgi:hypothetical protein
MSTVIFNGHPYSRESNVGREAVKFEQPGYRPEQHPFPRMMYKAQVCDDGIVRCDAGMGMPRHLFANDAAYEASQIRDKQFNDSCRMIVGQGMNREQAEAQYQRAKDEGWFDSAEDAVAHLIKLNTTIAAAAHMERLKRDQGMTEKARREAAAADAATPMILGEIPEAPRVRKAVQYDNPGAASAAPKKEHWKTRKAREAKEAKASAN